MHRTLVEAELSNDIILKGPSQKFQKILWNNLVPPIGDILLLFWTFFYGYDKVPGGCLYLPCIRASPDL